MINELSLESEVQSGKQGVWSTYLKQPNFSILKPCNTNEPMTSAQKEVFSWQLAVLLMNQSTND